MITVAVSYLNVSFIEAFFIAMTVATIKGSLVLGYFMHLITEKTDDYLDFSSNCNNFYHFNVYPFNIFNRSSNNLELKWG